MTIKRYGILAGGYTEEDPEGTLVEWDDVAPLLAELERFRALAARHAREQRVLDAMRDAPSNEVDWHAKCLGDDWRGHVCRAELALREANVAGPGDIE